MARRRMGALPGDDRADQVSAARRTLLAVQEEIGEIRERLLVVRGLLGADRIDLFERDGLVAECAALETRGTALFEEKRLLLARSLAEARRSPATVLALVEAECDRAALDTPAIDAEEPEEEAPDMRPAGLQPAMRRELRAPRRDWRRMLGANG